MGTDSITKSHTFVALTSILASLGSTELAKHFGLTVSPEVIIGIVVTGVTYILARQWKSVKMQQLVNEVKAVNLDSFPVEVVEQLVEKKVQEKIDALKSSAEAP
jgi:hypothetical protein